MNARRAIAALALALALALPATAAAKPGYVVKPKGLHLTLQLPASNGYAAQIRTKGHRQVSLVISRGGFSATYVALGRVTRKGIEADFGSLGHVSVRLRAKTRFHPSTVPGVPGLKLPPSLRDRCEGRRSVGEKGFFVGSVRFEGENGYTQVHAHRLRGKAVRSYRRVCRKKFGAEASKVKIETETVFFQTASKRGGVLRALIAIESSIAFKDEETSFTIAFGGEEKKIGRVGVRKLLLIFEDLDSIDLSPRGERPLTATVKMRKPFEGVASYVEEGKAPPSLTGTLGLRLPGSGLVPLAGPEFDAGICRADLEAGFDRCIDSLLRGTQTLFYGSGSHSQPLALARLSSLR